MSQRELAPGGVNPWVVAIAVMFGTFMEVLDTTVVNVSLPHIAGNLSATVDQATWAVTSYLAANAIILPMTGWLANHFGRKRLLMGALVGFTSASFLCGMAPSLGVLVFFRMIQGMTGGVMQPVSQAVLLEAFPPQDRGKAMGFWGIGIVVAPIIGPVLGGWLTDSFSWRWVFYINIPTGVVALVMTWLFIFDPPYIGRGSRRIDYWGIGLLAVAIGSLQIALDRGQELDWLSSHFIALLFTAAIVGGILLIVRELVTQNPVVDLRVFKKPTYTMGVTLMTVLGFGLYGSVVLLPILLQTLLGYSALDAGIAMAPRGMGALVAMPVVGMLMSKVDPRKLLATGFLVGSFTLFWLGELNLNAGYWNLFWPQFVQGISLGLLFVPLTTVTMDPISRERMGNATSLFNLTRNVGGSVGIALVETMVARHRQVHTARLVEHVNPYNPASRLTFEQLRRGFEAAGTDLTTATQRAWAALWGMVEQQAAMISFVDAFRALGLLFLIATPLVLFLRRPHGDGEGGMH